MPPVLDQRRAIGLVPLVAIALCSLSLFAPRAEAEPHNGLPSRTGLCIPSQTIRSWSLARRAAQLVAVPADETNVLAVRSSVASGVGAVVLFGSAAPRNLGAELKLLREAAPVGIAPLIMTDEEGGGVQRMANLVGSLPWPRTMAATSTSVQVGVNARQLARRMAANGITVDLAPVLDIASGGGPDRTHTDGPRSFSANPMTAATYGVAFAEGLLAGGVLPVAKHFPGEGHASANTDDGPATTPSIDLLERADLLPFEAAIRAKIPAIMVGNAVVPGLTSLPASLSSRVVTTLLRRQLGYTGLIVADSLSAKAIADLGISVPSAAVDAIAAGVDLVLYSALQPNTTANHIVASVVRAVRTGRISTDELDHAVQAVLAMKHLPPCR